MVLPFFIKINDLKTALIITTYCWPEALKLVLKSVRELNVYPSEVIIADDGSTLETKKLIQKNQKDFPIPLKHIWHNDKGFRRSHILNLAIANCDSDYIIQIDGDCILNKYFVKDHINSVKKNTYLYGSRVNIQENYLSDIYSGQKIKFNYFSTGIKKRNRLIRIPFLGSILYKPNFLISKKLRGCNLSYWKSNFMAVNGYNEDLTGWGREDSEMICRMINYGILGQRLKFKAIMFHIWHKNSSKEQLAANDLIQQNVIQNSLIWCNNGIDKYKK